MARFNQEAWKTLGIGLIGMLVGGGAAWGQNPLFELQPSKLTRGSTSQEFIKFGCYDLFSFTQINCRVTATLGSTNPIAAIPPFFGGHVNHTAPQPLGTVQNANMSGQAGPSVTGDTIDGFTVLYTAEEASGEVQFLTVWSPPSNYECQDMIEDIPGNFRNPCTGLNHVNVGLKGLNELFATPSDSFVFKPRPSPDFHTNAHFGTSSLQRGITLIGKTYFEATDGARPRVTDMSLPDGGLFDICGTYDSSGTCASAKGGGHVAHRTGHDVDFSAVDDAGQSIDCLLDTTDAMMKAFEEAHATFQKCYEEDGHYHVRFQ